MNSQNRQQFKKCEVTRQQMEDMIFVNEKKKTLRENH